MDINIEHTAVFHKNHNFSIFPEVFNFSFLLKKNCTLSYHDHAYPILVIYSLQPLVAAKSNE